jgi:hypothetical protein
MGMSAFMAAVKLTGRPWTRYGVSHRKFVAVDLIGGRLGGGFPI